MIGYILRYRTKISGMLQKHGADDVRTAFNQESLNLEREVNRTISNRCTVAFLAGALLTAIVFGGVFYYAYEVNKHDTLRLIENLQKG